MSNKKKHAEHNEATCEFLATKGDFPDWVITTAFYSALHYVQNEIFPLKVGNQTFDNIIKYHTDLIKQKNKKYSKHSLTISLVFSELNKETGELYRWMHDACMSSRYTEFNVDPRIAELSVVRLNKIKAYLTK